MKQTMHNHGALYYCFMPLPFEQANKLDGSLNMTRNLNTWSLLLTLETWLVITQNVGVIPCLKGQKETPPDVSPLLGGLDWWLADLKPWFF